MLKRLVKRVYFNLRKLFLGLLVRAKPLSPIGDPEKVDSILLIRLDRIGDLVVSIPAIKAVKKIFPKARITALLNPACTGLARLVPEIDEVVAFKGLFSSLAELKGRKFYLIIDLLMDYALKTALFCRLMGARATAGFDIEGRGRFFNAALKPSSEQKPMGKHLLDLVIFSAWSAGIKGCDVSYTEPVLTVTPDIRDYSRQFLKEKGLLSGQMLLGIAPGAKYPSQCWKEERFAVLADSLAEEHKAAIIVIGAKDEEAKLGRIISLMKIKPILALGLPLDKLAGVMAEIKVLISNNSGPLHMAAALGVATVSTMGPTVPHLWWPQGKNHIVIRRQLFCSPCGLAECRRHVCLDSIGVEEMEKAVEMILKRM